MEPSLKPPADMTDAELIEVVALEVMGWHKESANLVGGFCWCSMDENGQSWYIPFSPGWNPLTDWNHTMEVFAKLHADSDFRQEVAHQIYYRPLPSLQRAICLAALTAVRS